MYVFRPFREPGPFRAADCFAVVDSEDSEAKGGTCDLAVGKDSERVALLAHEGTWKSPLRVFCSRGFPISGRDVAGD